jgi:predicted transcriptional regulator
MNANDYLREQVSKRGLTVSDVARLTGLSQGLVSMHITEDGKNRRGIGAAAAWAYHNKMGLDLRCLLQREEEEQ